MFWFTLMTKIIINQIISIHNHYGMFLGWLFIGRRQLSRRRHLWFGNFYMFRINRGNKMCIGFFFVQDTQKSFFDFFFGICLTDTISCSLKQRQSKYLEMFVEFDNSLCKKIIFLLTFEKFDQSVFCTRRIEKIQSMFVGSIFIFEGIDFDNITGFRLITDRFYLSIDDSIFKWQSNIAMYSKCKIQNRASRRQFYYISLRCIQKYTFVQNLNIKFCFELFFVIEWFIVLNDIL